MRAEQQKMQRDCQDACGGFRMFRLCWWSMNQKLIDYLKNNETFILDEWNSQFIANVSRLGIRMSGESFPFIREFYNDLIALLRGADITVMGHLAKRFRSNSPEGFRLKLSDLLEILLSGEEVLREDLLSNGIGRHAFSPAESAAFFEDIDRAFHTLAKTYAETYCNNCLKPLLKISRRLNQTCHST